MHVLKRFLLSRTTVLTLIALMLGAVVVGYLFPQRFLVTPAELARWQLAHPQLAALSLLGALDHVYTSPWFALLLGCFLAVLAVSTVEQFQRALQKTLKGDVAGDPVFVARGEEAVAAILRAKGFRRLGTVAGGSRFVKHPGGYWGPFLLHLGIAVSIGAALVILLFEQRGVLHLVEGETAPPGAPWYQEERGLLAGTLLLPAAVRLDRVAAAYWPNDDLRQLTTDFSFIGQGGVTAVSMGINRPAWFRGVRLFQGKSYGRAFYVEFRDARGEWHGEILQLDQPANRAQASYGTFLLGWAPFRLKAKYYADAARRGPESDQPLLVLRLVDGARVVSELPLTVGGTGRLGPYAVSLTRTARWGGIIFIRSRGMAGIFFGFFIICLGGGLSYWFPPREILLRRDGAGCRLCWRAGRFAAMYRDEFAAVLAQAAGSAAAATGGNPVCPAGEASGDAAAAPPEPPAANHRQ